MKKKKIKTSNIIMLVMIISVLFNSVSVANNTSYASSNPTYTCLTVYSVRAKDIQVKAQRSSFSKTLKTFKKGTKINVLYVQGNWAKVRYIGKKEGWVQKKYIEKCYVPDARVVFITKDTPLKQSSNSKSKTLRILKKGSKVFYAGSKTSNYIKVEDGHYAGYVLINASRF